MKVGIIKERRPGELRVAITPDTVKKYVGMGLSVFIESKAGLTAAITDQSYKDSGANIVKTSREALEKADIVLKVQKPIIPEKQGNSGLDEVTLMKDGAVLICLMEPHQSQELIEALANKKITDFSPGDTIKVGVKIVEGKRERIQFFEGVCIAKKNRDINSSFTVRKISFGEGVERTFALYSPVVDSIKVIRSGKVRRAKLYYLRARKGKSARIAEKIKKKIGIDLVVKNSASEVQEQVKPSQEEVTKPQSKAANVDADNKDKK